MKRLKDVNGVPVIALSRRNLLSLLHKLDMPGSQRTLVAHEGTFVVTVQDDDEHYKGREAGPVHPETEAFVAAHTPVVDHDKVQ